VIDFLFVGQYKGRVAFVPLCFLNCIESIGMGKEAAA